MTADDLDAAASPLPPCNAFARARATNALEPPRTLDRRARRRFRDLLRHFAGRIGPRAFTDEGTRAKVGVLIDLVMKLEAARAGTARPLALRSEIDAVQQLTALLTDLGLDDDPAASPELEVKPGAGFRLPRAAAPRV